MLRVGRVEPSHVALDVTNNAPLEREALAPKYRPVPKDPDVVPVVVHRIGLGAGRALVLQFSSLERLVSNIQQQSLFLNQFLLATQGR